jgi:putative PIN family toxin of toxin-antitoxin system
VPDKPVRVVIDANVFVSAAIGRGPSTRLIDQWMSGEASFEVIVCPRLIGEISDVLDRPRLRKRISAEDAREFVGTISALPNQVPDPSEIAIATRDADDDYLVALAREHEAGSSPATTISSNGRTRTLEQSHQPRSGNG